MQIVLLIPTARQDCVSVCENECMLCAWSTCRQAADGQTGVVYSWGFSVLRIYKSDWYRNVALVSHTSLYLGLVEFYLFFKNEVFIFWLLWL